METSRASQTDFKPRIIPPYEIFLLVIEAMVDNALAVTTSAYWQLDCDKRAPTTFFIRLSLTGYFGIQLNRHRDRYALFRSATRINRDSRRIVARTFPRFPLYDLWSIKLPTHPRYAWVCPSIDVFYHNTFCLGPVQPEDYINDEDRRLAFNEVVAMRELYRSPNDAAAALLQHVRILRIGQRGMPMHGFDSEEIRCIESLPALELVQFFHYGVRFPPPPKNPEDRHRHGQLIPIDESMYPDVALVANLDPFGLRDLWGNFSKRGVRFELAGWMDHEPEDMTPRNELVQTSEGLMIRFTNQDCRCYLDPVETERKQMMEEMGFGSHWNVWLPEDMSCDFITWHDSNDE
ncbi:hypothetical protein CcaCcLH18_12223 [Colletotrichum camelliae]|nr:hypothetical protein CcaCcLH18_12223 [Colletotrichum camelliae]